MDIIEEMQKEVNIIGLLNIHLDHFQNLDFSREAGDSDLQEVEGEVEIEMVFKEVSIKIEI